MKRSTRIWSTLAGVFVLLLVLLAILPLLFNDRIEQRVKAEVNRSVAARVDWRHAGLSFFRHFPNLTLTLDDLTTLGVGRFQSDTLAAVHRLGVVVDVASVLRNLLSGSPVVVRAVELNQPRLSLIKLPDGSANWDITRKTDTTKTQPSGKTMAVSLKRFEISDGAVALDNQQARLKAVLSGYNQLLSGDFSQKNVAIQTRAGSDTVSVSFAGVPYLNRVKLSLTSDVQADLAAKSYTLRGSQLRLNDLQLDLAGSARSLGKKLGLDLTFKAPSTNFRTMLSLVPAIYAHDFARLKARGTFALNGQVKGEYGDSAFPAFALNAKVNDAAFQYPDLPLPARSIFLDLSLTNPGGSADSTVANLDRFHLLLGSNPVDASAVLRTPLSDPDVNLRMKGKVDLADVRRTLKFEGIDQLSGTIAADAAVRTRMSSVDRKQYDKVVASGSLDVAGLTMSGKTLPHPLAIRQASLRLAPQRAELTSFTGSIGSSDLQAQGSLENLLGYVLRDDNLQGTATVRSNRFNLDEWRSSKGDLQIIPVPPKVDLGLTATVAELTYGKLKATDAQGRIRVKDQRATLENFRMNALSGQIGVTGFYETTNPTKPTFDVGFTMSKVDVPSAFQAFTTVQLLAPVAKYAVGRVSTDLHLNGSLAKNMMPEFPTLTGRGALQTSQLALHDFPAMNKLVDLTKLQILHNPTLEDLRTKFQIQDGRLVVGSFPVKVGPVTMLVSGSNGLDQSLKYNLQLRIPRALLGGEANQAIAGLASKARLAGIDLAAAPEIPLDVGISGTVTNPVVNVGMGNLASSATKGAEQAVQQAATKKVTAEATKLVQQAEKQAADIRQQAQALADKVKAEGYRQADSLTEKAGGNPLLQAAAKPAADELRRQTDDKATGILREAGQRADSLISAARRQAGDTTQ